VRKLALAVIGIVVAGLNVTTASADGVFTWSGCYLGVHLGYGIGDSNFSGEFVDSTVPSTFGAPTSVVLNPSNQMDFGIGGIFGGAQAGCDYQLTRNWVIGVAAEASGTNINGNTPQPGTVTLIGSPTPAPTTVNSSGTLSSSNDFVATATARLGYSIGQSPFYWGGRGLFYVKGGAAWADYKNSFNGTVATTSCRTFSLLANTCTASGTSYGQFDFGSTDQRVGWTVGIGTEWMIVGTWSVDFEYDFLDFGTRNVNLTDPIMGTDQFTVRQNINEIKLGINYRVP